MAEPVVVTIPHKLGKQEADQAPARGLQECALDLRREIRRHEGQLEGRPSRFQRELAGQNTTGMLDVAEDHVRLEVQLPWMLAMFANKAKALVKKQGQLMLEKPTKPTTTRA